MSNLNLSDDALNTIVAKAIIDQMTPEKREALITQAVKHLLEEKEAGSGSYYSGRGKTAFQRAFDHAVERVAEKVATEKLETDPDFKAGIETLFADAARALFAEGETRLGIIQAIVSAIRTGLAKERY